MNIKTKWDRTVKRELKKVAIETGYTFKYLKNIFKEILTDDGEVDLQFIIDVSYEHDW